MKSSRCIVRNSGVALATIVLTCFFCLSVSAASTSGYAIGQESRTQNTSTQTVPASPETAPGATPKTASGQTKPAASKQRRRKKKVTTSNCDQALASGQNASKDCPPPKIVVRQGGTSEPSIQVAGGTTLEQTSHQRDADQMLGETDANLKKIADRQLTPTQQDMVSQVRQFMDQSKTARQSGDVDRARTLAWKAELLSEELVKPANGQ